MFGYIYKVTNMVNDKIYIGKKHSAVFLNDYYGSGLLINRAIDKYGLENFKLEMIDTADSLEELNEKEKFYIKNMIHSIKLPEDIILLLVVMVVI